MKILIVGHGFVGKAVDYGFSAIDKDIVDPKYGTSLDSVTLSDYLCVFVCVPTPMSTSGAIDYSILDSVMSKLNSQYRPRHIPIIIKSTITPAVLELYAGPGIVYNPEFLREKTALEDFVNPDFHVFGGEFYDTLIVENIYEEYSACKRCKVFHIGFKEASLVKYAMNSFLATKVTFFNQLYDVANDIDANYNSIIKVLEQEPRIGKTHLRVPGFDNKRGFGGSCFPKDTAAIIDYTDKMTLVEKVIEINNQYRVGYELDKREQEQNISFKAAK
jgi:UDPglucose 6-dehydrogenase